VTATREALTAAVLADPDDDLPRLVFADWCDENGEPERAEFVRGQCELARLERKHHHECTGTITRAIETTELRRRSGDLFDADPARTLSWFGLPRPWARVVRLTPFDQDDPDYPYAVARRGFLVAVHLSSADWLAHGDAVLAAQPVTEVTLTTEPGPEWATRVRSQRPSDGGIDWVVAGRVVTASSIATTWQDILSARWPTVRTWHLPPERFGRVVNITTANIEAEGVWTGPMIHHPRLTMRRPPD
jgi:uncharacterized protein (TIGR02996 family)